MKKEVNLKEVNWEIIQEELVNREIEGVDEGLKDFENYISEAECTRGLDFIGIEYDFENHIIKYDKDINTKYWEFVITMYIWGIEDDPEVLKKIYEEDDLIQLPEGYTFEEIWEKSQEYDDFTYEHRGADDGTFDYAGTFVELILAVIEIINR